jgi:type IV pilus assembly protein PilM
MVDWKKEIKLGELVGRKGEPGAGVATPAAPVRRTEDGVEPEKKSFWKREIGVRKPTEEGGRPAKRPLARTAKPAAAEGATTPTSSEPSDGAKLLSRFARTDKPVAGTPTEERPKPSRFARPVPRGAETQVEEPKKSSLFARARKTETDAPAEKKPSRFARVGKADAAAAKTATKPSLFARLGKAQADVAPDRTKTKKPSRFARPAKTAEETPARTRGRSPLARDISFRRRPKPRGDADGATKSTRGKKKTQIVGLKVGASHFAAAHVAANGQPELLQFAREPIERGIVVAGELRDPDKLGVALKEFFRRNKLPQKAVRLGIGTNRIGVRRFEITGLQNASHLENAIRFRAQEVLPIPLEEAVLDYQVVGETTDENGQTTYRVLLVVAYRDLVHRYVRACRAAGLKLVGIDLEAFALLRALGPTANVVRDDAAVVIVSVGHDRSTFVVADGGTCEFARVLDWGGGALDVAIARALDLAPSQAESIKQSLTLNATQERLEGHTQEQAVAVYEAARKELQTFVRELVSSLHFYQNQPGSLGIGEITITGGTAQLPGLAAELQRLIGVTVRVGDPFARLQAGKRVDPGAELGSVAVAIGLGIEN